MAGRISGNTFIGVGTAVVAPAEMELDFIDNVLRDVGVGVRFTDPPASLFSKLGLRPDTPTSEVVALIQALDGAPDEKTLAERVASIGISKRLADGASIATLVEFLWKAGSELLK